MRTEASAHFAKIKRFPHSTSLPTCLPSQSCGHGRAFNVQSNETLRFSKLERGLRATLHELDGSWMRLNQSNGLSTSETCEAITLAVRNTLRSHLPDEFIETTKVATSFAKAKWRPLPPWLKILLSSFFLFRYFQPSAPLKNGGPPGALAKGRPRSWKHVRRTAEESFQSKLKWYFGRRRITSV
ncbi:MAG: hypothetical protein ACTS4Z_00680 [Candidatus Hodgkinia cicadicola]